MEDSMICLEKAHFDVCNQKREREPHLQMADEYTTGTGSSVQTQRSQSQTRDAANEETTKVRAAMI